MVLAEVAQKILVPIQLPVAVGDGGQAVRAGMDEARLRLIENRPARLPQAAAQVYVFKPEREEARVEPAQRFPSAALDQQAGAGGLLDFSRALVVEIHAAVAAVKRIAGPDSIEEQRFRQGGCQGGQTAKSETHLGGAGGVEQAAGEGAGGSAGRRRLQRSQSARLRLHVRVEKQQQVAAGGARALVGGGGEAAVVGVGQALRAGDGAGGLAGGVRRSVIHHDALPIGLVQTAQASLNVPGGVEGDDDDGARCGHNDGGL